MIKREPLMTELYFEKYILFTEKNIEEIRSEITNPPSANYKLNMAYLDLHNYLLKLSIATYSAGYPIAQLTTLYKQCLDALADYKQHPKAKNIFFVKEADEYMNALTLLTWGITLPIEQPIFDQLVAYLDAEGQRDALADLLIANRQPQRLLSQKLYLPKLYAPLYEAALTRDPARMARFLTGWYKTCLAKTASYNLHTLHGGDDSGFSGYWAWEVAGLSYALELDDTTYRALPYYPADLVAFAHLQHT